MSAFKFFIKEVTARLKGDEAEVVAAKNARKAESAINGQLAALKAKLVDDESNVEDKQEALSNAKFPTTLITNNSYYVENVKRAYDALEEANDTLADTQNSILYFEQLLAEFDAA